MCLGDQSNKQQNQIVFFFLRFSCFAFAIAALPALIDRCLALSLFAFWSLPLEQSLDLLSSCALPGSLCPHYPTLSMPLLFAISSKQIAKG
jgi:hypothetical protein